MKYYLKVIALITGSALMLILWTAFRLIKVIGDTGTNGTMAISKDLRQRSGLKVTIEQEATA